MAEIKICACQMTVCPDPLANFQKIKFAIREASENGADILALPECALSGYPPLHYSSLTDIDLKLIAELNAEVCALAGQYGIWVILGTVLMSSNGLLNSALIISDKGEIEERYDKMHLIGNDNKFFYPGSGVKNINIRGVNVSVLICYDIRFPEPFRYARIQGAQLFINILNACGSDTWKLPVLEGAFRTRASENSCFLAAVNAAGPLQMAVSRIVNPLGLDISAAKQDTEDLIYAEINTKETQTGYYYDLRTDVFEVVVK